MNVRKQRLQRAISICGVLASLALAAGCSPHAPKGQVVATVNGQEITTQDLAAEARNGNQGAAATKQSLLQAVIGRVLLAQEAHAKQLDQTPGYPSDVARMEQQMLAQKLLQQVVKPPAKPAPADVEKFIASHPFSFAQRQQITADEVRFKASNSRKELDGIQSMDSLVSKLKSLNAPIQRQTVKIDTANIPPDLASRLETMPEGQLLYVGGSQTVALTILARNSVQLSPEQANAQAANMLAQSLTMQQAEAEVAAMKKKAAIVYQDGYAPALAAAAASSTPPAQSGAAPAAP